MVFLPQSPLSKSSIHPISCPAPLNDTIKIYFLTNVIAILHLCQSVLLHFFKIKSVSPFALKIKLKLLSGDFTALQEKGPDTFLMM